MTLKTDRSVGLHLALVAVILAWALPTHAQWHPSHRPSNGAPGRLASPWIPTNPDSINPLNVGIAQSPVHAYAMTTSTGGQPIVVFEQIQPGPNGVNGKPASYLVIREPTQAGWRDVAPPHRIGEVNAKQRNWKSVKFWYGNIFFHRLAAAPLPNDGIRVAGLELLGVDRSRQRVVRVWDVKDGTWQKRGRFTVPVIGSNLGPKRGSANLQMSPAGEVYFTELRTSFRVPGPDTAKDHPAIMSSPRHEHKGKLRVETFVIRRYDPDTKKITQMDYEAPPSEVIGMRAFEDAKLFHCAKHPIIGLRVPQRKAVEGPGKRIRTGQVMRWEGKQWQRLETPTELVMPAGQRPDGQPVWIVTEQYLHHKKGPMRPEFVELNPDGGLTRTKLPPVNIIDQTQIPHRSTVKYVGDTPVALLIGIPAMNKSAKPLHMFVGLAAPNDRGSWTWVGKPSSPAYQRPFHGGHDGILDAEWSLGDQRLLLLWQGSLPIHGPRVVYGAKAPASLLLK